MKTDEKFAWAYMLKVGTNMWSDVVPPTWSHYAPDEVHFKKAADYLRCDDALWRELTERARAAGFNMLLMDLGEGIVYPSHPELAVRGSWSVEKLQKELARLRAMGLEPIPKMNFSTGHDVWLGEYARMVSTPDYYRTCSDIIRDVAELFGHPRWIHLGYDEENFGNQKYYEYACVRQGELWWHDFLWFVKTVEAQGARTWIWSDRIWGDREEFVKRMPRSVLQSNWYYLTDFELDPKKNRYARKPLAYKMLDEAGFDQIPTSSNHADDRSFEANVEFCSRNLSPAHLKGFLMSAWRHTVPHFRARLEGAIDLAKPVIGRFAANQASK